MPTLRQLEYLVAIADLQNFRRAADACHISQPSLSQQVRALEDRLGVVLVERRASGAELTPIGQEITARARRLIVEVEDIRKLAKRAGEGIVGTIRFGVSPTLGPYLMPQIVAALHREQPDLRLYIREGIPEEQGLALSRGALDMLLGPSPSRAASSTCSRCLPKACSWWPRPIIRSRRQNRFRWRTLPAPKFSASTRAITFIVRCPTFAPISE